MRPHNAPCKSNPAHCIEVLTYAEYRDDIRRFADGKYNALLIVGGTGLSKTETLKEMLGGKPLHYEGGEPSAFQFHCDLYRHRNEFVILDDLSPKFYRDPITNSSMKVLTNTVPVKRMRHPTAALSEDSDPPSDFTTTSKVIVLTNSWESTSEHIRAIEGRFFSLVFRPTPTEVHYEVGRRGWFTDQEVYDFVWEHRGAITMPDMRLYTKLVEQKKAGANWRERGMRMILGSDKMREVYKLLVDESLPSTLAKCRKFVELGLGGRTQFYELYRQFNYYTAADPTQPPPLLKDFQNRRIIGQGMPVQCSVVRT